MNTWVLIFVLIQLIHFIGTWRLYIKAGRKSWEAGIPIYNAYVLMRIINRPIWWVLLLFVPIINLIMFPVIWVETIRSFGKNKLIDTWLVVLTFGLYIAYINYFDNNICYLEGRSLKPKTKLGEWVSSVLFAIITATLVHTYFMQPYTIPTSSLEKTLLVGDYLFVSKFHYGARVPMTSIATPMVHDTIPFLKTKSYVFSDDYSKRETTIWNKFQLPYLRFPALQKIERNDIVVFNQPADTLLDMNDFHPKRNYYKPIDKKTNLVKRCVGIPSDTLEIKKGYVFINGKQINLPERAKTQYNFFVDTKGRTLSQKLIKEVFGARDGLTYPNGNFALTKSGGYILTLTDEEADKVKNHKNVYAVEKLLKPKRKQENLFPHKRNLRWNSDFFGPIYIPEKGKTIELNVENIPFYKRIIKEYENNDLVTFYDKIFINGKETKQYTFKQDYYWMMGDNRQNSIDSRAWGFVPFDHVVGKPVFIWFSIDNTKEGIDKIRWNRLFTTVKGNGKPKSYFIYFIVLLGLYYGGKFIKKRIK